MFIEYSNQMAHKLGSYASVGNVTMPGSYPGTYARRGSINNPGFNARFTGHVPHRPYYIPRPYNAPRPHYAPRPQPRPDMGRGPQPVSRGTAIHRSRSGPPPRCNLCSYNQPDPLPKEEVRHFHFSAKEVRLLAGVSTDQNFLCPTCQENGSIGRLHQIKQTERLKVCLSSSTLHEFWMDAGYKGDVVHIDWLTSPGATIQALEYMFRLDYHHETRSMDILLVAGLNNVLRGENDDKIMARLHSFYEVVKDQAEKCHPDQPSTFTVATFLYPPQLAWFPDNGPYPYPTYNNKLGMMRRLNDRIINFNQKIFVEQDKLYKSLNNGVSGEVGKCVKFHTYGLRKRTVVTKRGNRVEIKKHRWENWREAEPSRMLHLSDEQRVKMGKAINNFFVGQFKTSAAVDQIPSASTPPASIPSSTTTVASTPPSTTTLASTPPSTTPPAITPQVSTPTTTTPPAKIPPLSGHNSQANTMDTATREIGEKLFANVETIFPDLAPKITGMLLKLDKNYLKNLLENRVSMFGKIVEAAKVLEEQKKRCQ